MKLITKKLRKDLLRNGLDEDGDHVPVLKIFDPCGAGTWLITESDSENPDILFGLCDLGFGCPELGSVDYADLSNDKGRPFGIGLERDMYYEAKHPLSVYADAARRAGYIVEDEKVLDTVANTRNGGN